MPVFEDPLRALRVELPPGFVFDPFTSTLTDFYFARWNRVEEIVIVYVQPTRASASERDEDWLARVNEEILRKSEVIDLRSPGGCALGAAFYRPDGSVERMVFVRGARVDFAIQHDGADPADADPWGLLSQVVSSAVSLANTNPGRAAAPSEIRGIMATADSAIARGDTKVAIESFRRAVHLGTASWLLTLMRPDDPTHILTALQVARILCRLGQVAYLPGILREAEHIGRRAERSLKEMPPGAQTELGPLVSETLDFIYHDLREQVDAGSQQPFTRSRALSAGAKWLATAAVEKYSSRNLEEAAALAAVALEDLLTMSVQRERSLAQSPHEASSAEIEFEGHWAAQVVQTLNVQYACAMEFQDAARALEASTLLVPISERLVDPVAGRRGLVEALQASALIGQAGSFLFLGDDALQESGHNLDRAERILDATGDEGLLRAQLCLCLGWNRFYGKQLDGLLALADRGLAAAAKADAPPQLRRSLHALRAQTLVTTGHAREALGDADAAIHGAEPPLSTHFLIRAAAKSEASDGQGAIEDLGMALKVACEDNPLGDDIPQILFAASSCTEPVNVPVSLDLTWAAQMVMNARRLAFKQTNERIAFDDAVRHRKVAQTLVTRLIEASQYAAALEAADRSRARSLNELLGRPQDQTVRLDHQGLTLNLTSDPVADLGTAARLVRQRADRTLEATTRQPALSFDEMYSLVAALRTAALVLQPVGERIHLFLIRPPAALVIAESTLPTEKVASALAALHQELGVFSVTRARSPDVLPLADIETDGEPLNNAIRDLSDALLEPIAQGLGLLQQGGGLIIVPYRDLSLIPYPLLLLPDKTPLVERVAVSVVPSLATLSLVRSSSSAKETRYFIAGDPAVDPQRGLRPLPCAAAEAENVQNLLLASGVSANRIVLRLREQASEPEYRSLARGCRLVHLACHAALREPAAQSALFLSSGPHDDGQLLPQEIANISLPGALVFLSACQTGLGRPTADGIIGLSRAFLEAGARAVVMSMWKVADEAAARLTHHFYRGLLGLDGAPKDAAHALEAAMLATRADLAGGRVVSARNEVLDDHPAHWAPFLLLGDGSMTLHD